MDAPYIKGQISKGPQTCLCLCLCPEFLLHVIFVIEAYNWDSL